MKKLLFIAFLLLHVFYHTAFSEAALKIVSINGTAKVQRANTRIWDNLSYGEKLYDNDIVETFFQTILILEYGSKNLVIMGSNTKALLIIALKEGENAFDFNTTLFSGGMFVKVMDRSHVGIFTAHGVAQIDSGSISSVVESKTGHTGFQVLGGSARVRNIAQQETKNLSVGQTTIVLPGKAPTAPLYMTYRHVSVLKHFFGNDYIEHEMKISNIKPTEDKSSDQRLSFSANIAQQQSVGEGIYKVLFSTNRIYGSIIEDRKKEEINYKKIEKPEKIFDNMVQLSAIGSFGVTNGQVYPAISLVPSFSFLMIDAGIRLPFSKNAQGDLSLNLSGIDGILDKIDHITIGYPEKQKYVSLCSVEDFTMGTGLVVNSFTGKNIYSVVNPLGIKGKFKHDIFNLCGFVSDISSFQMGGLHMFLDPSLYYFGFGYYYDANQNAPSMNNNNARFIEMPDENDSTVSFQPLEKSNVHIYELDLGVDLVNTYNLTLGLMFEFAQKIISARTDGFVIRFPGISVDWRWMKAGLTFQTETGRMMSSQFHSFYSSNRRRIVYDSTASYIITQNNALSSKRQVYGFQLNLSTSIIKGTNINFYYKQDLITRFPLAEFENDKSFSENNYEYNISFRVDEKLLPPILFGEIYAKQIYGNYFPSGASFLASWGSEAGLYILTKPLFLNMAFEGGGKFTYIDLDIDKAVNYKFNNEIDDGDMLFEFFAGARWGFL